MLINTTSPTQQFLVSRWSKASYFMEVLSKIQVQLSACLAELGSGDAVAWQF